jgi:hypothetical protein
MAIGQKVLIQEANVGIRRMASGPGFRALTTEANMDFCCITASQKIRLARDISTEKADKIRLLQDAIADLALAITLVQ